MPFVNPAIRDRIKLLGCDACDGVGDLCYVFYKQLMRAWNEEPRWRTAHRLKRAYVLEPEATDYVQYVYERVMTKFELADVVTAATLAYDVFFHKVVMKYEDEMEAKNGRIDE